MDFHSHFQNIILKIKFPPKYIRNDYNYQFQKMYLKYGLHRPGETGIVGQYPSCVKVKKQNFIHTLICGLKFTHVTVSEAINKETNTIQL